MHKLRLTRTRLLALAGVAAVAIAVAGTAVAAFPQDNVKLYTGCLTNGGSLVYVAVGDNPLQPCASPKQVVKLSGGDITSLTVTAPLTGGGTNGALTIGLDASATLPSCSADNAVPKWNLATSKWTCGIDNDTTYSADGTTLELGSGNVFGIDPAYRVLNGTSCASGAFANGINSSGLITCGTPATGGVHAYSAHVGATILAGETTVISKTVPAGTYLLLASVELQNQDSASAGGFSIGSCSIPGYSTSQNVVRAEPSHVLGSVSLSLSSVVQHAGGAIELKCHELEADVDVFNATLTAVKVDSLG
jgi:hypothetical protein